MGVLNALKSFFSKSKEKDEDVLCRSWKGLQELQKYDSISFKVARGTLNGDELDIEEINKQYDNFHKMLDQKLFTKRQEKQSKPSIEVIEKDFKYALGDKNSISDRLKYEIKNYISEEDYKKDNWNNSLGMKKLKRYNII